MFGKLAVSSNVTIINYPGSGQAGCIQLRTGVEVREMELHILQQLDHRQPADRKILVQQMADHSSLMVAMVWWVVRMWS